MTRNVTRADRAKGGRQRWADYCRSCDAPLLPGEACSFCESLASTPDFEHGDEAAREFLYRVGGPD